MTDTPSTTNDANHSSAPEDDKEYDVIICGTDLIQSILSSALSRAGKKVLHCDGSEWYGGFDAVLYGGSTLDSFIEGCEHFAGSIAKDDDDGVARTGTGNVEVGESNSLQLLQREKYGNLRLHSQTFTCQQKDSSNIDDEKKEDNIASASSPNAGIQKLSIDDDEKSGGHTNNNDDTTDVPIVNEKVSAEQPKVDPLGHGFCFDLTPNLLYASGVAVESLVNSGVAEYLEFKSLKGLYLLMAEEGKPSSSRGGGRRSGRVNKSKTSNNTGNVKEEKGGKLATYRVPCSKGDVFRSKLLSPMDKRRLMKFLQLISDYGLTMQMQAELEDYQSSTEKSDDDPDIADGDEAANADADADAEAVSGEDAIKSINERHLHQGRALSRPQNKAMPSSSEMDALMRCVREGVSFSEFLTKVAKLPERLSTVVIYALALAPFGYLENNEKGKVSDAVSNIMHYSTKDGVEDLVHHIAALGRFGDTAFLVPMYGSGELSQAFCRSGAVYGSTYMLRRSPLMINLDVDEHVEGVVLSGEEHIGGNSDVDTDDVSDSTLSCKHVILPSTMMAPPKGSETPQTRVYRRICVLKGKLMLDQDQNDSKDPPDTEQRHAIIIPPGTHGLQNKSAIHGVAVDDSAFVAPHGKNYTVLHLTTSIQGDDSSDDELYVGALSEAVELLIASQPTKDGTMPIQECYHMTFSYCTDTLGSNEDGGANTGQPGLHVCHRDAQSLTCDSAFREAKRIFEDICPEADFLELAKKVEDAIMYRDEHDSDDEKMVLESACTMIQAPAADEEKQAVPEDNVTENSDN